MSDLNLFSSFELGDIDLKNRVVMAPMTRSRAVENNTANELIGTYYEQRSSAGLIITEGTAPAANGVGYPRIPGIYNDEQTESWKQVTNRVHQAGGKIFMQLMHVGRVAHEDNLPEGAKIVAPTTQAPAGEMFTDSQGPQPHSAPNLMTIEDIEQAIEDYVQAAKNAIAAGFDGVEIHAANGYLIEQFINAKINELDNAYGGSIENRVRFALEVAERVVEAVGGNRVGIRISPYGVFNDMPTYDGIDDTYLYLINELNKMDLAYVHLLDHSGMGAPEVPQSLKSAIRDAYDGTLILCGNYNKDSAEKALQNNEADLIAFGRPFISNPDLVKRMKVNAPLADPDFSTFYTPEAKGYTDYEPLKKEQLA